MHASNIGEISRNVCSILLQVLADKVERLIALLKLSKNTVVYTGIEPVHNRLRWPIFFTFCVGYDPYLVQNFFDDNCAENFAKIRANVKKVEGLIVRG